MSLPQKGYPLSIEDCPVIPLKNKNGWSIQGWSRAGERTTFRLEPLNILLDAGLFALRMPNAICMTHGHVDHSWNLPNISGGVKTNTRETNIPVYFPKQAYAGLTKLLEAATVLSYPKLSYTEADVWDRHRLEPRPIGAGDKFMIGKTHVEVLQAVHVVHSVGYGFSTEKQKLKEEFKELAGTDNKKLVELKKQGVEIVERTFQNEFVFYCDSTIENLSNYDEWKKYPSIVVECSGYPEIYESSTTHGFGHTHYNELVEIIKQHTDKNWFLIHSSMKAKKDLLDFYQKELLNISPNIQILCNV